MKTTTPQKRSLSQPHDDSRKKSRTPETPYLSTSIKPAVNESDSEKNIMELQRLLYAMQTSSPSESSTASWNALLMRADLLQVLWRKVSPHLQQQNVTQWQDLQMQVQEACRRAQEQAAAKQQHQQQQSTVDATVRKIFQPTTHATTTNTASNTATTMTLPSSQQSNDNDDTTTEEDAVASSNSNTKLPSSPPATPAAAAASVNIQDMQKEQRQQIESAISVMAAQMKQETSRIHNTLQEQAQDLDALEDVATERVEQVTAVATDVQEHVQRNWTKVIGTWTLIFTMVGVFCFTLVTIGMVPKRPGACLFFCKKSPADEFCRVLPSGRTECISRAEHEPESSDKVDESFNTEQEEEENGRAANVEPPAEEEETKQQETLAKEECEMGMNGECLPKKKPSTTEETIFAAPLHDAIPDDTPVYQGKPFSASDLRKAAATGDVDKLQGFVEELQDTHHQDWINAEDSNGWAAIHLAARAGYADVLQILLEQEACRVQQTTHTGRTALDIARGRLGREHPASLVLEEYGAVVEEEEEEEGVDDDYEEDEMDDEDEEAEEEEEEDLLQGKSFTAVDLRFAAQQGNLPLLTQMIQAKPEWIDAVDENGWGALHQAVRTGDVKTIHLLVKEGCNRHLETSSGHTALKLAFDMHGEDHPATQFLWDDAAILSSTGRPFSSEDLRTAAQDGKLSLLSEMMASKPQWINSCDRNRWTALHLAARAGHEAVVDALLKHRADPSFQTSTGQRALKVAVNRHGEDHPVSKLLAFYDGAVVEGKPFIPADIRLSAQEGRLTSLSPLLKAKPEWMHAADKQGWSVLHYAARAGEVNILKFLRQQDHFDVHAQTSTGETALDIARQFWGRDHKIVHLLEDMEDGH